MNPWAAAIFLHFPQILLFVYAGLGLFGTRPEWRRVLTVAVILAVVLSIVRAIPALLGWHTLIVSLMYLVLVPRMAGVSFLHAFLALCACYVLISVGEAFITVPVLKALGVTPKDTFLHTGLYTGAGWLGQIPLLVVTFFVHARHFVLFAIPAASRSVTGKDGTIK